MNRRLTGLLLAVLFLVYAGANLPKLVAAVSFWDLTAREAPMARMRVLDREFVLPPSGLDDGGGREVSFAFVEPGFLTRLSGLGPDGFGPMGGEAMVDSASGEGYVTALGAEHRVVFLVDRDLESMVTVLQRVRAASP